MKNERVFEVLKTHNLATVATVGLDGNPKARSVDFVVGEDDSSIYFSTFGASEKVKEIENNSNVFVVVDHDCTSMKELSEIFYIKASGRASVITNPEEIGKMMGMLLDKFPYLKDLPGKPEDMAGIKIEFEEVTLVDNTKGFGNTEIIDYR